MNPEQFQEASDLFDEARRLPPEKRKGYLDEHCRGDAELRAEVESLLAHDAAASARSARATSVPPARSGELLATIAQEYSERLERGESPDIEEIARLHPELSHVVRRTLSALEAVRSVPAEDFDVAGGGMAGADPGTGRARNLGDFRIIREIGRGGMGVVFEAEQLSLGRRVALKVLPFAAVLDPRQLQRFKNEAQAAALLHHQNIVPVYGIGSARGVHYYAMQYVDGHTVAEVIRDLHRLEGLDDEDHAGAEEASRVTAIGRSLASGELDPRGRRPDRNEPVAVTSPQTAPSERPSSRASHAIEAVPSSDRSSRTRAYFRSIAELGIQVAEALDHAHSEGVVHRDIKPSNLILDPAGKIWVTDFGLARMESDHGLTMTGDLIGTLRYMSPEQTLAKRVAIDHRTDIYSLGVTLYELLTLRPAYPAADRQELIRKVAFEEPKRPRRWNRGIPAELETIVLKAIAKNPSERFDTARDMAEDLRRFLDDKPIQAKRATMAQRVTKWSRRHKPLVAAAAVVLVLTVAGLVISNLLIARQRDQAEARLVRLTIANGMRHLDNDDLLTSLPWFVEALRLDSANTERARFHRIRIRSILSRCPRLVRMWSHEGPVTFQTGTMDLKLYTNAEFSPDGRYVVAPSGNRTARVWDVSTGQVLQVLPHRLPVLHASFSGDGRRIATASGDSLDGREGEAFVWDTLTGERIAGPLPHARAVYRIWFSPDGDRVVTASGDKTARIWDARTGDLLTRMNHGKAVSAVAFSPDGDKVLTGAGDGWRIWDSATGELLLTLEHKNSYGTHYASFSPDGRRVVTAGGGLPAAQVWETASGERVAILPHASGVWHAAFSPDGRWIVTASADETAQVWDARTGKRVGAALRHKSGVAYAGFSPDGRHVVTASWDRSARVWETATGKPVTPPLKHGGDVMHAAFSPDGRRIVTPSTNLLVRVWDLAHLKSASRSLRHSGGVNSATFSSNGRWVVTASSDRSARVWDAATGEPVTEPMEHGGSVGYAAFSADGRRIVTTSADGTARIWDTATGKLIGQPLKHDGVLHASFNPDGSRVVTAGSDGMARVWDVLSGATIVTFEQHRGRVHVAWFSPDGDRVLTASDDGTAQIWDARTGEPMTQPMKHESKVDFASWSADGHRILTTSSDGTARVWSAATGEAISPPLWHGQSIVHGSFSPDALRVVTASNDNTAKVWNVQTGKARTLDWQPHNISHVTFSPDGRQVATACLDGAARVYDAVTGEPLTGALRHDDQVHHVEFSPDGQQLLTASSDGTARLWDLLPDERPVEDLALLAQVLCGHRIDATGGSLVPVDPEELRDTWQRLHEKYPDDFAPTREELFAWHRGEEDACERLEQWDHAIEHLERAMRWSPEGSDLSRLREKLHRLERLRDEAEGRAKPVPTAK